MKRILFLGASYFQLLPIKWAVGAGHHVITCDNDPSNPGHRLVAESWNISIRDGAAILEMIRRAGGGRVDAVIAYASDPAAPTAAWLCSELGLSAVAPYESVCTMTYKDQWRKFLMGNGFNCPQVFHFTRGVSDEIAARIPFIVKPCASSGSRGVSVVRNVSELDGAIAAAHSHAHGGGIIFEELIGLDGHQIAGDGFVVDGRLAFWAFANEHFASALGGDSIVPMGESFPWIGAGSSDESRIVAVVNKALALLGFRSGCVNFDIRIYRGRIYLMEIGARAGGNLIGDAILASCGVNLGELVVLSALGEEVEIKNTLRYPEKFIATYMIHAQGAGRFKQLRIFGLDGCRIMSCDMFVKEGDEVFAFDGSHRTIGAMILEFNSRDEMVSAMDNMENYIKVELYED